MRLLVSALLLFFCTTFLIAQPKQNSAYSRFGIGDFLPQYFVNQAGWGGQTAAFHDPYHLNPGNPASYAFLKSTALETGLYAKYSHNTSGTVKYDNWSGNISYLALGFTLNSPINEVLDKVKSPWRFGMGVSLTPYSLVGYKTIANDTTNANLGTVSNTYQGSGGTYRLAWNGGAKYKNTAFGLSLGWAFGKSHYETINNFDAANTYSFLNNSRNDISIKGLVYKIGVQHDLILKYFEADKSTPMRYITLGFTANSNLKMNVTNEVLFVRSRATSAGGTFSNPDTLVNFTGEKALKQKVTLPASFTIGIQYVDAVKFKAGFQFGLDLWKNYVNEARPEGMRNTISASTGIEYTPNAFSYNRYLKKVRYRAGAFYRQDPRLIYGKNLNNVGINLGLGFPITLPRQQTSFVNFAVELGSLGEGTVIKEQYVKLSLGFTLNDNTWFFKRRFE
jgi:hypothetical protein